MKESLRMFGQYAVSKGEGWRVGEGAELVDAYEATLNAPADRDVMRQAPNGWKLVPTNLSEGRF